MKFITIAALQHFNAIALESFVAGGGHAISGPLYVQGQFIGQAYSINGQSTVDCSPENQDVISKTGLVIDFTTGTYLNVALNGNAYIPRLSATTVLQETANCVVYQTGYYGPVSFATMVAALSTIERALINLPTTLQIKGDGTMIDANPRTDPRFDKVQFPACLYQTCPVGLATDSDTGVVLFNGAQWKGPKNRAYPDDSIIVFSIPVWANFFIYVTTDTIGAGVQPCRAIYHFYPVVGNPNIPTVRTYDPTAQAELVRGGKGYLSGLTFAPRMIVSDSDSGGFAGQIVSRAYQWQNPAGGTDILNYNDTGDICQGKFVCFPPTNYTRPPITTHSVTITTTTTSEETFTLQDTVTVTLPTDSEATVYVDSTHTIFVYQTIIDTTTETQPGYYRTFSQIDDTTTTTETTSATTNTHTEIEIINITEEETSTITEFQATATTTTTTDFILVPRPTSITITEYPTIYVTAYETVTLTVTETEHTGSSSSSSSSSSESESELSSNLESSESSESLESSSQSSSELNSSDSELESDSSSSSSDSSLSDSNSSGSSSSSSGSADLVLPDSSSKSESELVSESNSSPFINPSSDFTDECTQIGDHKTHHHHYHHDNEEDCEDESHRHHHKDEENCEDESHHHRKYNEENEGDGYDEWDSEDEDEEVKEKRRR
ncbi:hypothetical protein MAM1_0108d05469 [Mucor ambiguus]|uniref:Uncharacterized protein n=1 Tax=Mucor ambiguus TaxID=91626 RepID=A0A0C9MV35_9FUNG|nr:hypothetical protein MAM1_0108d05469 [Mucor ambiguus]